MAFDEVMWLTAEQRKIFMTACVLYIAKSLSESELNCANYLYVIYGTSRNTCVINTVLIFLEVI